MRNVILACVFVLIVAGGIGAVVVWQLFTDVTAQAVEYARNNDQKNCLDESMQRLGWCSGLRCQVKTVTFAHLCFQLAAANTQLCEEVPASVLNIGAWAVSRCAETNLPADACERIHVQSAKACLVERLAVQSDAGGDIEKETVQPLLADADYLGVIAPIKARVMRVRFFESGEDVPIREQRNYQKTFAATQARYIHWELEFEFPELARAQSVDITAVYYWPDGGVMGAPVHNAKLEAGWTYSWQSYGWGWPQAGRWPLGVYKAEFYVGDDKVAASAFTLR